MSNAPPIAVPVSAVEQPLGSAIGPGVSVQNLGAIARTLVYRGATSGDTVELWGSLDNVTFGAVERELSSGASEVVTLGGLTDNVTLDDDRSLFYATRRASGNGAATLLVTGEDVGPQINAASGAFHARNVGASVNVANLAAFTVAGNDGVTNVAGDVVLLIAQTDPTQNGPYVVGAVAAGVAPLTRPSWWAAGALIQADQDVQVAAGTLFVGSTWRAFTLAPFVVDAADPSLFPLFVAQAATLVTGIVAINNVPIRSATRSQIGISRVTPNTTALTVQYNPVTITPGQIGVALLRVQAEIAAGTINAADISTLNVSVTNGA